MDADRGGAGRGRVAASPRGSPGGRGGGGALLLLPLALACAGGPEGEAERAGGDSSAAVAARAGDAPSDAAAPSAAGVPADLTPPGLTPVVFAPGLVSKEGDQANAVIYPGGREIYFWEVENGDGAVVATIRVTRQAGGSWSPPETLPFSGTHLDGYLALHPDGSRLYFQSDRPIDPAESSFRYNLWYVERQGEGWSEARSMGRPINGRNHTGGASVTRDGTLYFTLMDLEGGRQEIYRSPWMDGAYQEPERLPDEVNVGFQNCDSYVAPDESYLVFVSFPGTGHADNRGRLLIAFRDPQGKWFPARELGAAFDQGDTPGSVTLSPDGEYVFFSRPSPDDGLGQDVYWVSSRALTGAVAGTGGGS